MVGRLWTRALLSHSKREREEEKDHYLALHRVMYRVISRGQSLRGVSPVGDSVRRFTAKQFSTRWTPAYIYIPVSSLLSRGKKNRADSLYLLRYTPYFRSPVRAITKLSGGPKVVSGRLCAGDRAIFRTQVTRRRRGYPPRSNLYLEIKFSPTSLPPSLCPSLPFIVPSPRRRTVLVARRCYSRTCSRRTTSGALLT